MKSTNDQIERAYQIAQTFLVREKAFSSVQGGTLQLENFSLPALSEARLLLHEFLWDDQTPLIEFPLLRGPLHTRSGSVIVSFTRTLPPIISYSFDGPTFYQQIQQYLEAALIKSEIVWDGLEIYLMNALEPIAKLTRNGIDAFEYLSLPGLKSYVVPKEVSVLRSSTRRFSGRQLEAEWKFLDASIPPDQGPPPIVDIPIMVLQDSRPTKYQQACNSYGLEACSIKAGSASNYCAPRPIAGCAPVAWAVLASAHKRNGRDNCGRIWADAPCWNIDWPSYGGDIDPTQCPRVGQTIWALHSAMGTSDTGATNGGDNLLNGGRYLNNTFGLSLNWISVNDITVMDYASFIVAKRRPSMFVADGEWEQLLFKLWPKSIKDSASPPGTPGDEGHCVVVYGYNVPFFVYVSMGWGSAYSDRWINLTSFNSRVMIRAD